VFTIHFENLKKKRQCRLRFFRNCNCSIWIGFILLVAQPGPQKVWPINANIAGSWKTRRVATISICESSANSRIALHCIARGDDLVPHHLRHSPVHLYECICGIHILINMYKHHLMKPLVQTGGQDVTNAAARYFWYFYNTQAATKDALKKMCSSNENLQH